MFCKKSPTKKKKRRTFLVLSQQDIAGVWDALLVSRLRVPYDALEMLQEYLFRQKKKKAQQVWNNLLRRYCL